MQLFIHLYSTLLSHLDEKFSFFKIYVTSIIRVEQNKPPFNYKNLTHTHACTNLIQSNPVQSNQSPCDNFFIYALAHIIQRGVLVHSSILCMSSWVHYSRTHLLTTVGTLPLVYE